MRHLARADRMPRVNSGIETLETALRDHALAHPETHEDFPWGEHAIKVRGKAFVFMRALPAELSISLKLPHSGADALDLPFTEPTHYGLGKSGWVTAHLVPGSAPPIEVLRYWIDESYRAVAPKKLGALVDARAGKEGDAAGRGPAALGGSGKRGAGRAKRSR